MRRSLHRITGRLLRLAASLTVLLALTGCGTMSRTAGPLSSDAAGLFLGDGSRREVPANGDVEHPTTRRSRTRLGVTTPETEEADGNATISGRVPSPADADAETAAGDAGNTRAATGAEVQPSASGGRDNAVLMVAQDPKGAKDKDKDEYDVEDFDPWERFNETIFEFNVKLDRHVLKPIAKLYDKILPDRIQIMIASAIDNAAFVPRLMNSLFQGKWDGAVRELSRFMLNTTVGFGGLFDIARHEGIEKSREDFGQTLGYYGAGPGPYVVVPFLEPLTVRDGIGKAVDMLLDPLGYVLPLIWNRLAIKVTDVVNDRSLNLELFQGFEETTIDLYSAVRHAYLQRRRTLIKE